MADTRTTEFLCITDSSDSENQDGLGSEDQDGSKFAEVFMQEPILSRLMSYLGLHDATRLSQAIQYCSFTSTLSRMVLFGHGAGKITFPLKSSYERTLENLRLCIETKKIEIMDLSGLEVANSFTTEMPFNLHIARVVAHSFGDLDEKFDHQTLIGELKSGIRFFFSYDLLSKDKSNKKSILIFSKKWEELLKHDKYELENLGRWLTLPLKLAIAIQPKIEKDTGLIVFDHERIAYLLGRAFSGTDQ